MLYTAQGVLLFDDEETLDAVVGQFRASGLLTEDDRFRTQPSATPQSPKGKPDIDREELVIHIPYNSYKEFTAVAEETVAHAAEAGIVWTTMDEPFTGGILTTEETETHNLLEWAELNGLGRPPEAPGREKSDEYLRWKAEVEKAFFDAQDDVYPATG
jgi:hypothetical protein